MSRPLPGKSCLMARLELGDTCLASNPGHSSLSGQVRPCSQEAWPGTGNEPMGCRHRDRGQTLDPCDSGVATGAHGVLGGGQPGSNLCSIMTLCDPGLLFPLQPMRRLHQMATGSTSCSDSRAVALSACHPPPVPTPTTDWLWTEHRARPGVSNDCLSAYSCLEKISWCI